MTLVANQNKMCHQTSLRLLIIEYQIKKFWNSVGTKLQSPPKPLRTSTLKTSSISSSKIRRAFIQIMLPNLRLLLELSSNASRNYMDSNLSKIHRIQALKSWRTFTTNLQKQRTFKEHIKKSKNKKKNKKTLIST